MQSERIDWNAPELKCRKCGIQQSINNFRKRTGATCKQCTREYHLKRNAHPLTPKQKRIIIKKLMKTAKEIEKAKAELIFKRKTAAHFAYKGKQARMAMYVRPEKKLPDREIYTISKFCELAYYLDFSELRDYPTEWLTLEHWEYEEFNDKEYWRKLSQRK